jgi:hypothetical protein
MACTGLVVPVGKEETGGNFPNLHRMMTLVAKE